MSRMIDADALMADCQLAQKQADRHGREFANAFYSGGGEISTEWWCVEDMIENAPTIEPEQRWIPVTERLPEVPGLYIVTNTNKIQPVSTRWYNKMRNDAESFWSGHPNDKVLAWMPIALPEPWKGDAE